ncbi:MAG: signal peptidase I, partial [Paracoccaceae bacterium]
GDKVQVKNGVVHINGRAAAQEQVSDFEETFERQGPVGNFPQWFNGGVGIGGTCLKQRFTEALPNGVVHSVLSIRDTRLDNTPVYTVPEGHYFFMGDNRDNSTDSRVAQSALGVGFVPHENLIGRADRIIFSSAGKSMLYFWTWRGNRFFKAIN